MAIFSWNIPRRADVTLKTLGLASLAFFGIVVVANWWAGDALRWSTGGSKEGDLLQHYAAGQLAQEARWQTIYRNHSLGDWMNGWHKRAGLEQAAPYGQFNYVYSPLSARLAASAADAPFAHWLYAAFGVIVACYAAALWVFFGRLERGAPLSAILAAAAFPSVFFVLIPLQNTTLTLLLLCAGGLLLKRKRMWLAGAVVGCAAFYKPQLAPLLALFLAAAGQWQASAALVGTTALWLAAGVAALGWEPHALWFQALQDMMQGNQIVRQELNQSLTGFFKTVLPQMNGLAARIGANALALAALAWAAGLIWRLKRRGAWSPELALFAAITWWLMASPYVGHYEILLGLPWWLAYMRRNRWSFSSVALLAVLPVVSLMSVIGLRAGVSLSGPLLLLWLLGSLQTLQAKDYANPI